MRKSILLFLGLVAWCGVAVAQKDVPSLVVTGESKIFQMPDIMEVNVTVTSLEKEYYICIERNLKGVDQLKQELQSTNVSSLVIKDVAQRVNEERSYSGGKSLPAGYRANYQLIIQLSTNPHDIHKVLTALRKSGVESNYHAAFKLTPELLKKTNRTLTEMAVRDAMEKAHTIASASNCKLENILRIVYGGSGYRPGPVRYMEQADVAGIKRGVGEQAFTQPDPIELTDNVVITWQIR